MSKNSLSEKNMLTCPVFLDQLAQWLQPQQLAGRSVHTLKAYRRDVAQWLGFLQREQLDWPAVDALVLGRYAGQRIEQDGLSPSSLQRELSAIRHFGDWLVAQGLCTQNPARNFRIQRPPRPLPAMADPELLSQLLDQPAPDIPEAQRLWRRDRAMLELLYSSGLRVAELTGLDVQDLDWGRARITVTGKGNKTRIVPVGQKALQALRDWLPERALWQEGDEPALFLSERLGQRLSTRTVERRIKVQAQRAGIAQDFYPHLLRHCFASHVLASSGDLRAVQELLGHANISTTQIYTHLDYAQLARTYDQAHPRAQRRKSSP